MAKWNKMIYTEEGRKLLANVAAGTCQVEFVRTEIGDGTYSEEEKPEQKLRLRTQLKNERNSYGFSSIKAEDNTAYLKVALQNADVDTAYFVNELGVFAREKGSNEEAVLVLIAVAEIPDYFPEKSNAVTIIQNIAIEFANAKQLSIADDMGAYALANVEYSIPETLQSLVSGENIGTALGKLARAVECVEANNLDVSSKVLPTGTNVDDLRKAGVYYFIHTHQTYNLPNNSVNGWLIVLRYAENVVKQLFFHQGTTNTNDFEVYVRSSAGETAWGEWRCFATKNPSGALLLATENPVFTGNGAGNLELRSTTATSPYMTFHRPNSYAVHLGLGSGVDDLCIGGWSAGAVQYPLLHSGNYTKYAPEYEEGEFSPSICKLDTGYGAASGKDYTVYDAIDVKARYKRVGKLCYIHIPSVTTQFNVKTKGYLGILWHLPFTPKSQFSVIGHIRHEAVPIGKSYPLQTIGYDQSGYFLTGDNTALAATDVGILEVTAVYEIDG